MIRRLCLLLAAAWSIIPAQAAMPGLDARLLVEDGPNAGKLFVAYLTTQQPFEGRYELSGEKKGVAGSARVKQAGAVKAVPHQALRLSHLAFGAIAADDHYTVRLKIFRGSELVSEAQIIK
ncbi:curli-like amyloid fiber formation chaperone CsgH [Sphingobium bisphenolivorans]|uniref:curli-like amyloid fiber formation chaperone CsgH n=1 Tax=Sphingobium bisphenolivorans TaxID=1335760 RepID=UPI0003A6C67B|nr:curli-like amyloid fiber formation chaperone CsgH [Sphingobium bisphenolivorans]